MQSQTTFFKIKSKRWAIGYIYFLHQSHWWLRYTT